MQPVTLTVQRGERYGLWKHQDPRGVEALDLRRRHRGLAALDALEEVVVRAEADPLLPGVVPEGDTFSGLHGGRAC